jgi:hypothetical protein
MARAMTPRFHLENAMRGSIAVVVVGSSVPVFAAKRGRCWTAGKEKWLDTVKARIAELGYVVRAIKSEGGYYEISAVDFNGAHVELHVNAKTGMLVESGARRGVRSQDA